MNWRFIRSVNLDEAVACHAEIVIHTAAYLESYVRLPHVPIVCPERIAVIYNPRGNNHYVVVAIPNGGAFRLVMHSSSNTH